MQKQHKELAPRRSQRQLALMRCPRNVICKLSEAYFHENPSTFCKVLAFAYAKQQHNKLEEVDRIFGFPKNKKYLDINQLRTYVPKNEDQIRKIIMQIFGDKLPNNKGQAANLTSEDVLAFSKWLAENGGFSGLIEGDQPPWKKSEGLCYIAFLRQYGLYNYRMINTLHKVHSKVIAEAITVLYNCNDAYDINDMRILRIGNLVRSDEKKFEPNICILKSLGWWDERVTPEQFQMLLHECNYRLVKYVNNIGKDWSDKILNPKFKTKQDLMDHLKRLRKNRKNKFENQLIRKNKKFDFDSFLNDTNAAAEDTEVKESDDELDISLRMEAADSEDENDNEELSNENTSEANENDDKCVEKEDSNVFDHPQKNQSLLCTLSKRKTISKSTELVNKRYKPGVDEIEDSFNSLNSTNENSLGEKQLELQEEQKVEANNDADKKSLVGRLDLNTSGAEMMDQSLHDLSVDVDNFMNRNILDTYEKQWESQEFCDTALVTACGKEVMAHRFILSAWSPVFLSDLKNTPKNEESKIEVEDVSYTTVYEMLRFMYSGKIKLDEETIGGLLTVADRYQVRHLKKKCQEYLLRDINIKNAVNILTLSKTHNMDDLQRHVEAFIRPNAKLIFKHSTAQTTSTENESDFYFKMVQNIAVKNSPTR